ncbi:hypothetical protein [Massilicoli timonensis]|uniref:hypothetical protein n=1 Tax=Massilicoli timonensis TaxID=2015901 RepID=UPI003AABDD30
MDRREELIAALGKVDDSVKQIVLPMIDDVIHIETRLMELRKLPFISIHPRNEKLQRPTAAAKLYKELLQQYNNCIKILCSVVGKNSTEDESILQKYMKQLSKRTWDV